VLDYIDSLIVQYIKREIKIKLVNKNLKKLCNDRVEDELKLQ